MSITQGQRQQQRQQQQQRMTASQRQTLFARILDSDMNLREIVAREIDENPALELEENDPASPQSDISLDDLRAKDENEQNTDGLEENIDDWDSMDYVKTGDMEENLPEEGNTADGPDNWESNHAGEPTEEDTAYMTDDWEPNQYDERTSPPEASSFERKCSSSSSFFDDLQQQLQEMTLSERERFIATNIIGNLESNGYLLRSPRDLADDLLISYGERFQVEEIEQVLTNVVQQLEPAGVGARNLAECMALQLKALKAQSDSPLIQKALHIIEHYFDEFSRKQYDQIMRKEELTQAQFNKVQDIIRHLTPYPGPGEVTQYITPDFLVEIEDGKLRLSLANEYHPKLRISREYNDLFNYYRKNGQTAAANQYKELIEKANHFIDILPEIHQTLHNVMATILVIQEQFFLTGDPKTLKPMILKDIADILELDESTVSRCTSRRYVQTPHGIYLLKSLFSEATNKEDGIAANALKVHIIELIENEDKHHPLTDEDIMKLLAGKGFRISRRTVAKYREQLGISASSARRI